MKDLRNEQMHSVQRMKLPEYDIVNGANNKDVHRYGCTGAVAVKKFIQFSRVSQEIYSGCNCHNRIGQDRKEAEESDKG